MSANGWVPLPPGIDAERGFLARPDPLVAFDRERHEGPFGEYLARLDELGASLPERLETGSLRPAVRELDPPPEAGFAELTDRELVRLRQLSAYLASAYVNEIGADPVDRLPAGAAVPLYRSSSLLGREPVIAYDVLCLHNFRRADPAAGFDVEDVDTVQQFTRLDDETWFVAVHVAIEAAAAPALTACPRAQRAVARDDPSSLEGALATIADSLEEQTAIMRRMTAGNAPSAFASKFRPYFDGFEDVVFEGVDELAGEPQSLRGASGAQSSVMPSIDATLGVEHESTALLAVIGDMRSYMPTTHREAIEAFEAGPDVRRYVAERDEASLVGAFNRCVDRLGTFRRVHFGQVVQYIREVSETTAGTGGTDFMPFLEQMRAETEARKL